MNTLVDAIRWLWLDPSAGWLRCLAMTIAIALPLGVYALIRYADKTNDEEES